MAKEINLISKPEKVDYLGKCPWDKIKLKKLMTDVAKGKLSMEDAELLMNPIKDENSRAKTPKKQLNNTGGKNE